MELLPTLRRPRAGPALAWSKRGRTNDMDFLPELEIIVSLEIIGSLQIIGSLEIIVPIEIIGSLEIIGSQPVQNVSPFVVVVVVGTCNYTAAGIVMQF